MKTNGLDEVLERFSAIAEGTHVSGPTVRFESYAVSNFRGGIGKTTLTFNLAYELSRDHSALLLDLCPQRSFTELLLGDAIEYSGPTIYDALLPKVMPGTDEPDYAELTHRVSATCPAFKGGKPCSLVPGANELFLFPSNFYNSLNQVASLGDAKRVKQGSNKILSALSDVMSGLKQTIKASKVLIDTSPFFAGGTHLAWAAVDALIIPVRVDQQSIDALRLTLDMLRNPSMDFMRLNERAGRTSVPKVHAIALTHCGWARTKEYTPDQSTQAFVSKVLDITQQYADLFSSPDPADCIFLMDDFHSAGRISGAKRIPLAHLEVGKFVQIEGTRLQVNESLDRYVNEVKALASIL